MEDGVSVDHRLGVTAAVYKQHLPCHGHGVFVHRAITADALSFPCKPTATPCKSSSRALDRPSASPCSQTCLDRASRVQIVSLQALHVRQDQNMPWDVSYTPLDAVRARTR